MKIEDYEKIKKVIDLSKKANPDNIEIKDYTNYVSVELIFTKEVEK